jgi:hypothetical protein
VVPLAPPGIGQWSSTLVAKQPQPVHVNVLAHSFVATFWRIYTHARRSSDNSCCCWGGGGAAAAARSTQYNINSVKFSTVQRSMRTRCHPKGAHSTGTCPPPLGARCNCTTRFPFPVSVTAPTDHTRDPELRLPSTTGTGSRLHRVTFAASFFWPM